MAFAVSSTPGLARKVNDGLLRQGQALTVEAVPELAAITAVPGGARDLLNAIGWMTAGPPSLTAEALRGAGRWAFTRYGWAFENHSGGFVAATDEARAIGGRNRAVFSEAVGVGASGWLIANAIIPSGPLLVADLEDTMALLSAEGVLKRWPESGRKRPDYLFAIGDRSGLWKLISLEAKGTINGENTSVGQLIGGASQAVSIVSVLPVRSLAMSSSVNLDQSRKVETFAVEVVDPSSENSAAPAGLPDAVFDAGLLRALRLAGRFEAAEAIAAGSRPSLDLVGPDFPGPSRSGTTCCWRPPDL